MEGFDPQTIAIGLVWYVVFLMSTVFHEAAHALAAKVGGDLTAFHGGQVSLDPMPHIRREPMGMVVFPLLTFALGGWMMGWASTPYDPYWAARHPRRAAWMALAGPASNLTLVLISGLVMRLGLMAGWFTLPMHFGMTGIVAASGGGLPDTIAMFLSVTFSLNLILGFFNLLPVPPLDGSSAITLVMTRELGDRWTRFIHQPMFAMVGLLVAWRVFGPLFDPIYEMALRLLYARFHGW